MDPQLKEIYRLTKENNAMLHSLKRHAFWGGMLRLFLYVLALGVPIWLYFTYLAPVVQQIETTVTSASGKKTELEGQFAEWMQILSRFKDTMQGAPSASSTAQ